MTEQDSRDLEYALSKWERVKAGERDVVVDDETLDILTDHFRERDDAESDIWFRHSSSPHNPNRVGLRDAYVLHLSDKGRNALEELADVAAPRR